MFSNASFHGMKVILKRWGGRRGKRWWIRFFIFHSFIRQSLGPFAFFWLYVKNNWLGEDASKDSSCSCPDMVLTIDIVFRSTIRKSFYENILFTISSFVIFPFSYFANWFAWSGLELKISFANRKPKKTVAMGGKREKKKYIPFWVHAIFSFEKILFTSYLWVMQFWAASFLPRHLYSEFQCHRSWYDPKVSDFLEELR